MKTAIALLMLAFSVVSFFLMAHKIEDAVNRRYRTRYLGFLIILTLLLAANGIQDAVVTLCGTQCSISFKVPSG